MIRCDGCDAIFDSDADPDCFCEVGNMRAQTKDVVWCESCRNEKQDEDDRAPDEPRRPMPANIDQLIADHMASDPAYSCKDCDWDVDGCLPCEAHQ